MTVIIFRSAGTAAQPEFQEMPFIMNVRIFRSTGTAAQQEFHVSMDCRVQLATMAVLMDFKPI